MAMSGMEFGIHPTVSPASHTFTDEWGTPHHSLTRP